MKKILSMICVVSPYLLSCNGSSSNGNGNGDHNDITFTAPNISFSIINSYPHDTSSFTQGLSMYNGQLYESTGSPENTPNNGSWIGKVDLQTGKPQKKVQLPKPLFGEGNTVLNNKIYQITWTDRKGFVYDAKTLKKIREFSYKTDGWGITNNGVDLIMSDGTNNLYFLDPDSLVVKKTVPVMDNNGPVPNINELEFIDGFIYANQWETPYVLKINPETGKVTGRLDLSPVVREILNKYNVGNDGDAVLNGIAYDSGSKKIYVTGKKWPALYEIRFN